MEWEREITTDTAEKAMSGKGLFLFQSNLVNVGYYLVI